jgi:hypothetical protein
MASQSDRSRAPRPVFASAAAHDPWDLFAWFCDVPVAGEA